MVGRALQLAGRMQQGFEHVDEFPGQAKELLVTGRELLAKQVESIATVAGKVATRRTLDGAVELGAQAGNDLKALAIWAKDYVLASTR